VGLSGHVVLLCDGVHVLSKVFLQDLAQEGHIGAVEVEGGECDFEGLDVVALLGVVLEVVLFGGEGEAADGYVDDLAGGRRTRSRMVSVGLSCQPSRQLSRVMTSAMWNYHSW